MVLSTLPSGTHAGDIFVDAHVSWSTGNSLTLSAYHDILSEVLQMIAKPASMFAFPRPSCKTDARC